MLTAQPAHPAQLSKAVSELSKLRNLVAHWYGHCREHDNHDPMSFYDVTLSNPRYTVIREVSSMETCRCVASWMIFFRKFLQFRRLVGRWHTYPFLAGRTCAMKSYPFVSCWIMLTYLDISRFWYGRGVKKSDYFLNIWEKVKWLTLAVEPKLL